MIGPYTITADDEEYQLYTFKYNSLKDNGEGQTEYSLTFDQDTECDILIVGGGGGGGTHGASGGGGGGGVIHASGITIINGTYKIKVGSGGNGDIYNSLPKYGYNGNNSEFFNINDVNDKSIAYGGGGGSGHYNEGIDSQAGGSSGGTSGHSGTVGSVGIATKGILGTLLPIEKSNIYGNIGGDGGNQTSGLSVGGGGGGANNTGGGATSNGSNSGGDGIQINIDGNNYYWAGGGGGGTYQSGWSGGNGGKGGGGGGASTDDNIGINDTNGISTSIVIAQSQTDARGGNGADHTGGGGGGANWQTGLGGAGGSGIVIIRYKKIVKTTTTATTTTTTTEKEVTTLEPREVTINTVIGNQSVTAYEWSNLEKSDSLHLSNLYMNINNGKDLINKFYTGFEFSTTYWCKFDGTAVPPAYEIKLGSDEHTILELKQNIDNLLELSLDITNDSNQILTTAINETLLTDHWYLVAITAGISDKYVSLSLAVYDSYFDGTQDSYISSSVLVPQVDDYKYDINNYTNEFKINATTYGDVRYYNKFITLVDIYNILIGNNPDTDTLTLSGSTATVSLIGDSTISTDPVSFAINLDGEVYKLTGVDSLGNSFTATTSSSSSVQTIKIVKGTQLTLNVSSSSAHPFIIVQSKQHNGSDSNRYTTGVTYDESTVEKYDSGQINGAVVWDTRNSDLGLYYGICINHPKMYFIIELTTGNESTITTASTETITQVNIDKYYRFNMSFSFSKNDLALTNDATDLTIRSDTKTYLKFVAGVQPKLELYTYDDEGQQITELVTTAYNLSENIWYDFYVTLKYDGTDTTGEIYIGKDKKIDYFTNYIKSGFIPFKGLDSTDDSLEVRIGVDKDEDPVKLDKKIENINIFTKKLNKYTINNLITNNVIAVVQPASTSTSTNTSTSTSTSTTTVESNKLELWYRLSDFTNGEFNNVIADSSGKGRSGTATGNSPTQQITNNRNINKSYKLLKNNLKAMKITDSNFNISTPAITLTNNFSIMIKTKLELGSDKHNVFTYNDLSVDISNTELTVVYGATTETITTKTIAYTFEDKWYAISLTYKQNRSLLSVYINEELQNKYSDVSITASDNILKLTDYSSKPVPSSINLTLEDLRIFSNEVNYSTIYEYANGINIT